MDQLRALAEPADLDLPQLALRWVIENQTVSTALVGFRNPDEVAAAASAADADVPAAAMQEAEGITRAALRAHARRRAAAGRGWAAAAGGLRAGVQYREMGTPELRVSVVGFGGWPMGGRFYGAAMDDEATSTIHAAHRPGHQPVRHRRRLRLRALREAAGRGPARTAR